MRWAFPPVGHDIPPLAVEHIAGGFANAPEGDYLDARVGPQGLPTLVYLINCYYGFYSRYPLTTTFLTYSSFLLVDKAFFFLVDSIFYLDFATIDFNSFFDPDLITHSSTASSVILKRVVQQDSSFFHSLRVFVDYCVNWFY